jgi:hypothetical protein
MLYGGAQKTEDKNKMSAGERMESRLENCDLAVDVPR